MNNQDNALHNGKAKEYQTAKIKLFFAGLGLSAAYLLIFQLSGLSKLTASFTQGLFNYRYLAIAAYLLIFAGAYYIIELPLKFYAEFILEKRYNLSNQKLKGWIKDEIKKTILGAVIYLTAIELFYILLVKSEKAWWIWLAGVWFVFSVFFARVFPTVILPLFYKYKNIENAALKQGLREFLKQNGVEVLGIYQINLSSKTKKANAALTGLGKSRRVILADNLLDKYTDREIMVVLAHEIGHHKHLHVWAIMAFSAISNLAVFYLIARLTGLLISFSGISKIYDPAALPSICLALLVFGFISMPLYNAFSRILEIAADRFALRATQDKEAFITCMNKLGEQNLSDRAPDRLTELMFYDHPPISKRIKLANEYIVRQ